MEKESRIVRSVCPLDCPDTCSLSVHIDDGKITKVTGNKEHPVTKGAICHKVRHMPERLYQKDRLLYPLKRIGKKGEGTFKRISWEEAYSEIIESFQSTIDRVGAEGILPYSFYGNMGVINSEGMDRRFFHRLGASFLERTICNSAGSEGFKYTMGMNAGIDPEETVDTKLFLIWGCNMISTNMHQTVFAEKARKKGAKIIAIDVHRNRTARWADEFVQLRPGTDAALALGLMHILIRENWVDHDFIEKYTTGYAELVDHVQSYTPNRVTEITGVPEVTIEWLARLYGKTSPSFIRIGNGLQHHDNGGMIVRTISCLPALTGQWGVKGGGALKGNSGYASFNKRALQRPDLHPNPDARSINMNQLGDALLKADPPVKTLFVYNSNPAQVAPDQAKVRKGLESEDLFTIVHDIVMTDTCKYADIVLPATSHFENLDLYKSYWHLYIQLHEPVIRPMGECKSNFTVFKELAHRMGFDDDCFSVTEEEMIREALDNPANPYLTGITYEKLKDKGWLKLNMSEGGLFPDKIRKTNFYSETMEKKGLPPLPEYTPLKETGTYPLTLVSGPNHQFLNSTFGELKSLKRLEGSPTVYMHPTDAAKRQISDNDNVRIYNDRGHCHLKASVTTDVLPGTIVTQGVWWQDETLGYQSINTLTSQRLADMGGGATFFSVKVNVEKAEHMNLSGQASTIK